MAIQRWNIDTSHAGIHFTVRHMVVAKVRGAFNKWQGTIDFDPAQPEASKVEVTIDAASVDTREPQRDNHLRSADFLDVEKYPTLNFVSTAVERVGKADFRVRGELTLHGVTRPVDLEVEHAGGGKDPWGNERIVFEAKTAINRKDFGLGWNQVLEAGGVLVGEKIDITIELEAVKAQAVAA